MDVSIDDAWDNDPSVKVDSSRFGTSELVDLLRAVDRQDPVAFYGDGFGKRNHYAAVVKPLKPRDLSIGRLTALRLPVMFEQAFRPFRGATPFGETGKGLAKPHALSDRLQAHQHLAKRFGNPLTRSPHRAIPRVKLAMFAFHPVESSRTDNPEMRPGKAGKTTQNRLLHSANREALLWTRHARRGGTLAPNQ